MKVEKQFLYIWRELVAHFHHIIYKFKLQNKYDKFIGEENLLSVAPTKRFDKVLLRDHVEL